MVATADEASRLVALLQEEDDGEDDEGSSSLDEILRTYGGGGRRHSDLERAAISIDNLLGNGSPPPVAPSAEHPPKPLMKTEQKQQSPTSSQGSFLSFIKKGASEAGGATQQLEALACRLRQSVGGITTSSGDGGGWTTPTESAVAVAGVKGAPDATSGSGGSLLAFASQVASTFGESVGGLAGSGSSQGPVVAHPFPSEDFVEIEDSNKVSLWAYLSSAQQAPVRSVEIKVRPDVSHESILGLCETLVLSHGVVVKERGQGTLMVERSGGGGRWSMVVFKLGVNTEKVRILLVQFFADPGLLSKVSPSSPTSMASTTTSSSASSAPLCAQLLDSLGSALVEGGMTLSSLPKDQEEEVQVQLDPCYVRDLQAMFAAEMMSNLETYAGPLDAYVKNQELRCARLMTTLQPIYERVKLEIPRPVRAKALTSFPLDTSYPPISEATIDSARQILSKVQSQYRKDRVSDVVRRVWKELQDWCDDESRARVKRKNQQVASRLRNVEQHGQTLVRTLRDSPQVLNSPMDKQLAAAFRMAAGEAVILDCAATLSSRPGRLFITASHLWFHSQILGFTWQKALPMNSIRSVESTFAKTITVVDQGGERHNLVITSLNPADFADRVLDVLRLVLDCWRKENSTTTATGEAPAASVAVDGEEEEEGAGLAKKFASIGMTDELVVSSPAAANVEGTSEGGGGRRRGRSGDLIEDEEKKKGADSLVLSSTSTGPLASPKAAVDTSRDRSNSTGSSSSLDGNTTTSSSNAPVRSKSLRLGIQAFLSESQGGAAKKPTTVAGGGSDDGPLLDFS